MPNRLIQSAILFLFFLFMWGPALQKKFHLLPDYSLVENRQKILHPKEWNLLFKSGGLYARKYEEYYNDRYGFRDLFIRLKNQVDFVLFRQSRQVVIGHEGWLFYKSVVEQEQLYIEEAPDEAFETMYLRLGKLNRLLQRRGITLVILPCPMNNSVYPEMLPATTARRPHPTGFERYREYLQAHPEILSLDPTPFLVRQKSEFNTYHKTDFHWTDPAGAYVARDLVNLLAKQCRLGEIWNHPIQYRREFFTGGGENNSIGLLWPIRESYLLLDPTGIPTDTGEFQRTQEANEWTYKTRQNDPSRMLPTTVLFGDSFGDAFERAGFAAYFNHLQKFYNYQFKEKFPHIPPGTRCGVLEHNVPFLNALLGNEIWPEEILQ